ncbi:hypothetical protein PL664_10110, partial [Phocaeicola vulgatus]|nr:hypothetical protein [Phocaeicola vulgatus]
NSSCSDWLGYTLKRKLTNQENPLTPAGPGSSRSGAGKSRKPGRAGYGKGVPRHRPYHREHAGTEGRGGELEGGALPGSDSCRGCEHTLHF